MEAVGEAQGSRRMKGPSAAAEPGNGDGLRAAPELLERRRLAGSTGVLRTGAEFAAGGETLGKRCGFLLR